MTPRRLPRAYGAQELAAAVEVERVNLSMWLARGYFDIPEPDARLACGPIWLASDELRDWIRRTKRKIRERTRRSRMLAMRREQIAQGGTVRI